MYSSQVVNAVVLPLHVVALQLLARDVGVMGVHATGGRSQAFGWAYVGLIVACVTALTASWIAG
jgi:Mn2+/Fe2+ NRAMP family transporter